MTTDYDVYFNIPKNRASCIIDSAHIDGRVYVYNTNNIIWGIYKRLKSSNTYSGYELSLSYQSYYSFIPDNDYNYYVIYGTENESDVITLDQLQTINETTYVYTGDILNDNDIVPLTTPINLINPSIIHIGKYYHGAANPSNNGNMAYTDLIPIHEYRTYYFPFITLGYSWYDVNQNVISGEYQNRENQNQNLPYIKLVAPTGAAFIGISVRTGDIPNMILSEIPNGKTAVENASSFPVLNSKVVKQKLNYLFDLDFKENYTPSRLFLSSFTYSNGCAHGTTGSGIVSFDLVTMNDSKITMVFSIPSGSTPDFVFGYNSSYSGLTDSTGGFAVRFLTNGTQVELRTGTGSAGSYETLLKTVSLSGLTIHDGQKYFVSIEKASVNKQIVKIYNALTPNTVISETVEATETSDPNAYTGQVRCWGGPYFRISSGSVDVHKMQMYSTAPTYPKIAVWGDSYVENVGRNPRCGHGYLLKEALDGDVFLSGRGGATAQQTYRRLVSEINLCSPQYAIFNLGVNDSLNVSVANYKEYINTFINMAKERNIEPILITTPRISVGNLENLSWIQEINPWIRNLGHRYIDVAYALSTGNGTTADTTKFMSDLIHPNLKGGEAIFNYIKAFLPDLLWK